jgi:hypothetical protein
MNKKKKTLAALLIALSLFTAVPAAFGIDVGDVLKKGAIIVGGGYLVKTLGPQLNDFINTLTFQKGVKFEGYTKVVPIVSFGSNTRIGAAQVGAATKEALDKTKAVAQLEGEFNSIRASALIPVDSTNPIQRFRRVKGVGVTAIIDVKL